MRSTDYAAPFISRWSAVIGEFRSSSGPLLYRSPVVAFFDHGHPRSRNFDSVIPVYVISVKFYVDSFRDPTCVQVRVSINKLNLVPNWIVAGLVGVFTNGGGLIPVVLLDPLLQRSPCSPMETAALAGNPVDHVMMMMNFI